MSTQILIVEDDESIRKVIGATLKVQGYSFVEASSGQEALSYLTKEKAQVMLLDLGLPDMDGQEVIRQVRQTSTMPIIVISARTEEKEKVLALDEGADDYLTKPFSVEELRARLKGTFRRLMYIKEQTDGKENLFKNGELTIDYDSCQVSIGEKQLHLTPYEYKLLCLLATHVGKVLTHSYLTKEIWGASNEAEIASLRVFMATLRKKVEKDTSCPQYIQTHVGIGYRMIQQ